MPTQPAVLGTMRLGNFRLGYASPALTAIRRTRARITIGGLPGGVREDGLTIHDALNDSPNTASLVKQGTPPVAGQDLRISINSDTPRLLFNGTLQTNELTYTLQPDQLEYPCSATDDLARLNHRRPFGTWVNVSATTVAQQLLAASAPGFSPAGIAAGLPLISITCDGLETFSSVLKRIAADIGGYYFTEDLTLYLFQTLLTDAPDAIDGTAGRLLDDPPIRMTSNDTQLRTRVYGKGHGEAVLTDVAAGETILPIANAVMFNPAGGRAIAGTTPGGAQSQRLVYAGVQLSGAGSIVGPAVAPTVKPTVALASGAGITPGTHQWAYTFKTAAGETMPSPLSVVLNARTYTPPTPFAGPPDTGPAYSIMAGTLIVGASYTYKLVFVDSSGTAVSLESPATPAVIAVARTNDPTKTSPIYIPFDSSVPNLDPLITKVVAYRSQNGGAYVHAAEANTAGINEVTDIGGGFGTSYPGSSSATYAKANLTAIAIGPSGTTQRKVYRTEAGLAQLKLQQTIANNTATSGVQDATADGALGANAPVADTSGLTTTAGQVGAGSTSLLTAGAGPFAAGGGWAQLGQQTIRYTGITDNTLTGIPTSGVGALVNTVKYGEHVDAAAALTGVTGLALPMQQGAAVHVWVERNDLTAQAARVAVDLAQGRVSDGVIEHTISDGRRGEASLIALCDADLALFSFPIVTVVYATHDVKTKSGKTIHLDLASPPIGPIDLTIQSVEISEIDLYPATPPRFLVTASNVRFSLEDLLQRMAAALEGA